MMLSSMFRDQHQYRLFALLILTSIFNVLLVLVRMYFVHFDMSKIESLGDLIHYRGTSATFLFMIWNLFLAWIPYLIALCVEPWHRRVKKRWFTGLTIMVWLLFFPNAPYIITDLLHLQDRPMIPHWYDLMLFVSFAWTGLMLGYFSLFEVQRFLEQYLAGWVAWTASAGAILLGSFGVYLGRYQRWNSWDILTNPFALFRDIGEALAHPGAYLGTMGITVVLGGFMLLGYLMLSALRRS